MSARNPALSCDVDTQACDAKIAVRKGQVVAGGGGWGGACIGCSGTLIF